MPESRSESVLPNQRYEVVGTRPIRHDGVDKVTGQARYGADIRLPGMLYSKVLRSPHAHARILSIDTSRAEALSGVHAVVTAADLVQHAGRITDVTEGMMHNLRFMSNNILAADKVLYKGHAVVAVAATSVHVAEEALGLIAVAYEVLPAVLTAAEAMKPGAPLLHERLASVTNVNIRFRQLAARQLATGGPIMGRAGVNPAGPGSALGTHIVDVEVEPETGKVQILRYTSVQDVGKAIHPSYVEGRIQGGTVQGIGWALHDEYLFSERGHMLNASYLDYRVPVCLDLPMIDIVLVEVPNPNHPFGVRGVGEVPIVPPMAAIANAIYRAIGVRLDRLPMSPGRVLAALWAKNGAGNGTHHPTHVLVAAANGTAERHGENGAPSNGHTVPQAVEVATES